jgi:hypothetical protein
MIRYASDSSNPAFPFEEKSGDGTHYHSHSGMTMRNYFAAKALAGLCANPGGPFQRNDQSGWGLVNCDEGAIARACYLLADAMLKETV